MAKTLKVAFSEAKASIIDGKFMVEAFDEETGEEKQVDVVEATGNILKQMAEPVIDVTIKEFKPKKESNRKPIFKYKCECGKEIKSSVEELHIQCKDCGEDFAIQE